MEENNKVPVHVSIIMDGNGRWAQKRGKERFYGHIEGVESVRACTEEAVRKGVRYLSLFAFSEENWNRPEEEVHSLMELMVKAMVNELPTFLKNGIKFIVLGNRARLSDSLNRQIDDCMDRTSGCTSLSLVIFLSYSGGGTSSRQRRGLPGRSHRTLLLRPGWTAWMPAGSADTL